MITAKLLAQKNKNVANNTLSLKVKKIKTHWSKLLLSSFFVLQLKIKKTNVVSTKNDKKNFSEFFPSPV